MLDVARTLLGDRFPGYRVGGEQIRLGFHPENPVNLPPRHGVQIELPPSLRGIGEFGEDLTPSRDGLVPEVIAALVELATRAGELCGDSPRQRTMTLARPHAGYIVFLAAQAGVGRSEGAVGHMWRQRVVWAAAIVMGAIGLAACSSSPSNSSSTTTSTAIAPASALATGTYVPADSSGTPHYVVTITSATGVAFRGHVTFAYQDGTTSHVLDFNGIVTGQNATATPSNVETGSTTKTASSVPSSLQIGVGNDTLTFEGCQAYLPQALSAAACTFTVSR